MEKSYMARRIEWREENGELVVILYPTAIGFNVIGQTVTGIRELVLHLGASIVTITGGSGHTETARVFAATKYEDRLVVEETGEVHIPMV